MKVMIEIELGNERMETASDVSHGIQSSLSRAPSGLFDPLVEGDGGAIIDGNGNTVGKWEVVA
jgi:hypothetical protein